MARTVPECPTRLRVVEKSGGRCADTEGCATSSSSRFTVVGVVASTVSRAYRCEIARPADFEAQRPSLQATQLNPPLCVGLPGELSVHQDFRLRRAEQFDSTNRLRSLERRVDRGVAPRCESQTLLER